MFFLGGGCRFTRFMLSSRNLGRGLVVVVRTQVALHRLQSLMHVVRNRKAVTEAEVRYYVSQMVDGCRYLRERRIVHRDLKLGNMLLNDNMQVKIADFGLATRLQYDGQKKM